MTPEKKAREIYDKHRLSFSAGVDISNAIREAVEAEREACAEIAETHNGDKVHDSPWKVSQDIAEKIRQRKDQ